MHAWRMRSSRGNLSCHAGQAASRYPEPRNSARRLARNQAGECSSHRHHQPRPSCRGARLALPRGCFFRLSSIQIRIPSLAERLEDIPLLVQSSLKKYNDTYGKNTAGLRRRAQTLLLQHPWPGNVRELENVISTACITATGDFIDISDLPEHLPHRTRGFLAMIGGSCFPSTMFARCTSRKCCTCATAIASARRRFLALAAPAFTATCNATAATRARTPTALPPDAFEFRSS